MRAVWYKLSEEKDHEKGALQKSACFHMSIRCRVGWKMPLQSAFQMPQVCTYRVRLLSKGLAWPLSLGVSGSIPVKPMGSCWLTLGVTLVYEVDSALYIPVFASGYGLSPAQLRILVALFCWT